MKYLPSKKLIISAVIAFSLIGSAFWLANKKDVYQESSAIKPALTTKEEFKKLVEANKDSDGDGLKDWEEVLWQTDPNKIDTDDDGTTDAKEIELNRNPTIPGPDDSLTLSAARNVPEDTEKPLTLTEKIGREFITNYLTFKTYGESVDPITQQELVEEMLKGIQTQELENFYALENIETISDADSKTIGKYAARLETVLAEQFASPALAKNELEILQEAMQFNVERPEVLEELKPYQTAYHNAYQDLLKIKVPESYAGLHLSFINTLAKIEKAIIAFQNLFTDPAQALQGLKWYQQEEEDFTQNFQKLEKKLKADRVYPDKTKNFGNLFAQYR